MGKKDFFISYTGADRAWAEWIARQLEGGGFTTVLQAWDFRPGGEFVQLMRQAYDSTERVLAVVTAAYFASPFARAEWDAAFADDPEGKKGKLVPVRVEDFQMSGLDRTRIYVDLVGLDEDAARQALLSQVRGTSARPTGPVRFPGTAQRNGTEPTFPGNRPKVWRAPARNPNFTGRSDQLEALRVAFTTPANGPVVEVLHGLGGVGKSQIAAEYVHRFGSDYDVVWWVPATMSVTTSTVLAALGQQLGMTAQRTLEETASLVWETLSQRDRWLVVFDYAERAQDLEAYRPRGVSGHVLVTSRSPAWGGVGSPVEVTPLPREDSMAFLVRRLQGLRSLEQEDRLRAARDLAEELGDLPLALEQAAAYIEQTGMPVADYLALFQRRREELLARGQPSGYEGRVDTTWQLAFTRVEEASHPAAELLRLLAFLAPDPIPLSLPSADADALPPALREAVIGELGLEDAIGLLNDYSLIDRDGPVVRVHRLVQAVVRQQCSAAERGEWAGRAVRLLQAAFPKDAYMPETWPRCAQLVAHVLVATDHAEQHEVEPDLVLDLLREVGIYLGNHVELGAARAALERAVALAERTGGPDAPANVDILTVLGNVLREQGSPAEAQAALERALGIAEKTSGPNDPVLVRPLSSLAVLQRRHGSVREARQALERALSIQRSATGDDSVETGAVLMDLGIVLWDSGDIGRARPDFERALEIYRPRFGPRHPKVATALTYLGGVLRDLGELDAARANLEEALTIDDAAYGPDHARVAARCNNLATVLWRLGDLDAARERLEQSLRIDEAAYGPQHPEVATVCNNLGIVLRRLGRPADARRSIERALEIDSRTFGADHPRVGTRCSNLGDVVRDLGDAEQAMALYRRALAIFEAAYGQEHPIPALLRRKVKRVAPIEKLARTSVS